MDVNILVLSLEYNKHPVNNTYYLLYLLVLHNICSINLTRSYTSKF